MVTELPLPVRWRHCEWGGLDGSRSEVDGGRRGGGRKRGGESIPSPISHREAGFQSVVWGGGSKRCGWADRRWQRKERRAEMGQ